MEESPKFLRAVQLFLCLLLFGSRASNARQPGGPVPGAAAVRVHHRPVRCSQDTRDWRQTGEPSLLPAINTKGDGYNYRLQQIFGVNVK